MIHRRLYLMLLSGLFFSACSEVDPSLGIERYYGDYSGLALRTYKHLDATNSFFITEYSDWDYFMTVSEDTTENCLNLIVVYNDTTIASLGSVLIDDTGFGEKRWGAGSSTSKLNLQLHDDTIDFYYFQLMGHTNWITIEFQATK
ncbi:MAG: hypothetical protein H6548_09280 [Chitinophagales bacterium]|nr:hypothetical protein [Chitinophagales bacterium]MCB9020367.1 hypothetical protein [Chitinophagales bacterium]MCB9022299.1 hypothetical protein [Chitinophagales bacterium]HQU41006.1 hypothetical protein [Chitinophagales bacterium]HQU77310.1 hypothetical protein [Chitinophagales bacterium]